MTENWEKSAHLDPGLFGESVGSGSLVQSAIPAPVSMAATPDRSSSVEMSDLHETTPAAYVCVCVRVCVNMYT